MVKVLITGGCGFVGVNLVDFLLKKGGFDIRVLDNLSACSRENLENIAEKNSVQLDEVSSDSGRLPPPSGPIQLFVADIRDKEACSEAANGMDAVIHLAAHAGVIPSIEDPFFDFDVNALGTLNILNASVEKKVDKFIFASSNAPVGDQPPPMNEELVPRPLSPYGASKLAGEGYCSAFHGSYGLKTVVLRFSNLYGPYSLHKNSVVAKFIKDATIEKQLTIYGDGSQTRDFIYVKDLCDAICRVFDAGSDAGIWGETFNLGTGEETRIADLAEMVSGFFEDKIRIVSKPRRGGEINRNYSDISKVRKVLGFSPQVGLKQGGKEVYQWFVSQGGGRIKSAEVLSGSE